MYSIINTDYLHRGPWNNIQAFKCEMLGSSVRHDPGVPFDVDIGLRVMARYWRLVITKNHGASLTSMHGIAFYGYDTRVLKLIEQLKLTEYADVIVDQVCQIIHSYLTKM